MRKVLALAVFALFAVVNSAQATPIGFSFSNSIGASIDFDGAGNFTFTNGTFGNDFFITQSYGFPDGSLSPGILGDQGNISGTFSIGTILCGGPFCSAPVTGSGTFSMTDSLNNTLTSTVAWIDIYSVGTGGGTNVNGTVNLTNLSYSGTNPDYLAWLAATGQTAALTFQFIPARTLFQLKTQAGSNAYSGTAAADLAQVPEPATVSLLGMGLMGVAAAVRRRRARK